MAELITEIISQEAFNQVKQMDANLEKLVKQFENSARASMLINQALTGSTGYKGATDAIKEQAAATSALEKEIQKLKVAQSEEGKEIQRVRTETALLNAETRKAEKDAIQSANAYKMLSLQHREATETAKKLGAQLGVTSKEFQTAAALANKYDQQLKAIDSGLGNYKRNVGNYASATMSLSQVLRELPAFTYSAQTGILGISNNLPILADNFKDVARATNDVTGKVNGTIGALKIFAGSILSMGNIFTIALGIFTIFSKEIFEFLGITKNAKKEMDDLTKSIGDQTGKFETLTRQLNNHNLSKSEHLRLAKELKDEYPTALKNYSLEEIAAGKAADAILLIKDALIAVAMARAAQEDVNRLAAEKYQKEKELALQQAAQISRNANAEAAFQRLQKIGVKGSEAAAAAAEKGFDIASKGETKIKNLQTDISDLDAKMNKAVDSISKYNTAAKAAGIGMDGKDATAVSTPSKKANTSFKLFSPREEMDDLEYLKRLNEQIDQLISNLDEAFAKAGIGEGADLFDGTMPTGGNDADAQELANQLYMQGLRKHLNNIKKATKEHRESEKAENLRDTIKLFNDIAEATRGLSQILNTAAQIEYENDIARIDEKSKKIEDQYELELRAIERSGKTATQIEKEKQQLEAKTAAQRKQNENERIQAAKRRAQFNKASDIAEIITSTALAVVSNLKESPVMAAIAAAIGAANLARAIATPLPSYEKGTQNHPGGFAQVSEAGQELVIQPDGKKYLTPKRKSIIHLPKGSKVIPNHELIKSAQNAAMIKLAGSGNVVTADSYGEALIDSFETKIEKLIKVTERKNTNVSVNLYGGFETYVKSNIR